MLGAELNTVLELIAAVMVWPVMLDCTVMLEELTAVTAPVKSAIESTLPEGIPTRAVVFTVKVLAWVKSTPMLVVVGDLIALLRLMSSPIH